MDPRGLDTWRLGHGSHWVVHYPSSPFSDVPNAKMTNTRMPAGADTIEKADFIARDFLQRLAMACLLAPRAPIAGSNSAPRSAAS
jgi:hypothetical protein